MIRKTSIFTKDSLHELMPTSIMQWEDIQKNTFTNWVNEQLSTKGVVIHDVRTELAEHLWTLVEVLQRRSLVGTVNRVDNQYARLQNITVALDAISSDGVRIVNIDSSDVVDGNLKLILALIWQLILRYQIGFSNIQNKNWLLAWLQAVIPKCKITNFTTDWNDGTALHALLEFCLPGLSPNWKHLDKNDRVNNCRHGMQLARQQFGIPLILRPEHLASTELDDMSAITYLSYFIKVGSPGYNATLQNIQPMVHNVPVSNFTTDWNDGRVLIELVINLGAKVPEGLHRTISSIERLQEGIDCARHLGVEPLLTASEIVEEDQEHLGIMAYAAKFLHLKPGSTSFQNVTTTNDDRVTVYEEERRMTTRTMPNISHKQTTLLTNYPVNGEMDTYRISSSTNRISNNIKPLSVITNEEHPVTYRKDNKPLSSFKVVSTNGLPNTEPEDSFSFVRIPSLRKKGHKPKTETIETIGGIKVDTYSVGVIISTTSHEIISKDEVIVEAESPNGRVIKLTGDGTYNAQFTPDEIGEWKVYLYCHGKLIDSCPIDVCDPSQVKVTGLKGGLVNKKQYFTIDCQSAGKGDLEVFVTFRGSKVHCNLTQTQPGLYTASYLPYTCGTYHISVSFNKSEIRDSDYLLGSDSDGMHRRAIFATKVEPDRDKFNVKSTCDWQIDYITGGPFEVYITDKADIKVYSMQDGTVCSYPHLIGNTCSVFYEAEADCSGLDPAPLEAQVSYNGIRYPGNVVEDDPGVYRITFNPRGKGTYKIWIVFDGRMVKGSPFIQEIEELSPSATGEGLKRGREGHKSVFKVDARGFPGELSVHVDGPHFPINCNVKPQDDGTHIATYIPEEPGPHRVHVRLDGKDIDDSPFRPLVVDPSKVMVSGGWQPLLDEHDRIPLVVNKEKQIPFDASEAGPGELTADVHGPSYKVPVAVDSRLGGKHTLIFTPKEEGRHYVDVKWCQFPISKTPFLGYAVRLPESDHPIHPTLSPVVIMKPKKHHSSDPTNIAKSPNRYNYHQIHPPINPHVINQQPVQYMSVPENIDRVPNRTIKYISVPEQVERVPDRPIRYVSVPEQVERVPNRLNGDVIDGPWVTASNRKPTIHVRHPHHIPRRRHSGDSSSSSSSDEEKWRKEPKTITVLRKVSNASSRSTPRVFVPRRGGSLYSTPTTSNTEPERFVYYQQPRVYTTYVATSPSVSSRSSRSPSRSPSYKIYDGRSLSPKSNEHSPKDSPKVILSGKGLKQAFVNKPAHFDIDGRQAGPGEPTTQLVSTKQEIPVDIKPIGPKQYHCTYVPTHPGAYLLDIKWHDRPLKCCPFKINVNPPYYPEKVDVTGPNMKGGVVGRDFQLQIDHRQAGQGKLTAKCAGPHKQKVPVTLQENVDGTKRVSFKPIETGRHILSIKYNKEQVLGSPYAIDIEIPHYSGIVYIHGPGIEKNGVLGEYESHFWVDARDAGSGELNVSVMGPKGAFNVEMKRDSQKDKIFHCRYNPHEPGTYTINVRWSGHHVGKSPYRIHLGVSQEDLERFLLEMQADSMADTLLY